MLFDVSLTPPQIEFVVKPGVTLTQAYSVTNNGSDTLYLIPSVNPWQPLSDDGSVSYDNISMPLGIEFSLANAETKINQTFSLAPKTSKQLVLKIKTTSDFQPQDVYATFFISQDASTSINSSSTSTQATARLGSHILLTVNNTADPQSTSNLQNLLIIPRFKDIFFTPITIQGNVTNDSEFFFKTFGHLTLSKNDLLLKDFELVPLNVLSHHNRQIQCSESCTFSPPFWPGAYTATLSLDASASGKSVSTTFFIFPFSVFIPLMLIFAFVFISRYLRRTTTN